jgi:hypothetical protein
MTAVLIPPTKIWGDRWSYIDHLSPQILVPGREDRSVHDG